MPPQQRPPAPPSVLNAVRLMYAGAAVSLISIIIGLTTIGSVKTAIRKADPTWTQSQINNAANFTIALVVVVGLIGVGLWIWMAQMSKAGRNWARVTGTVFFGIDTLLQFLSFARSSSVAARIPGLIIWLIGLGAVILLWQRASSAFFKDRGAY